MSSSPIFDPTTLLDSYKLGHRKMFPPNTEYVYSNLTARTSRVPGVDRVVFFGLQAFTRGILRDAWSPFFAATEDDAVACYERRVSAMLGPEAADTAHLRALHRLGYLPLRISALPEGTEVPLRIPMLTVENTDPQFYWLTNYIESIMSAHLWHPITSATTALRLRRMLDGWAARTSSDPAFVDWQGHDFSLRGMTSLQAAAASGAAHLLSFAGTDSVPALDWIEYFYDSSPDAFLAGSVPATEHAVMSAGGVGDEIGTFARLLDTYPTGILSVVSDTWDLWRVCTDYLPTLRERVLARDGKLVIRPDSGDPVRILCGDPSAPPGSAAHRGVVGLLWDLFGGTTNNFGYNELDSHVGVIYGDSITYERAHEIAQRLTAAGFASTTPVLGVGSYTYQHVTRDTYGMAVKATWAQVDGVGRSLHKDPVTDSGTKTSAKGRLAVISDESGALTLVEEASPECESTSFLQPVWQDGRELRTSTWDEIVERVGVRHLR